MICEPGECGEHAFVAKTHLDFPDALSCGVSVRDACPCVLYLASLERRFAPIQDCASLDLTWKNKDRL